MSIQVIRRSGKWLYDSLIRSYLEFFKAVGLLGCGGWPGAATNELHMFWHERFMIPCPKELIVLLFPFLPKLEKTIKELGAAASLSMHAAPLILGYLARVVIQDAAGGMSQLHPDHDVHVLLNTSAAFRFAASVPVPPQTLVHHTYEQCMTSSTTDSCSVRYTCCQSVNTCIPCICARRCITLQQVCTMTFSQHLSSMYGSRELTFSNMCRSLVEEHQYKRRTGYYTGFRPFLMADRMGNIEGYLGDIVTAIHTGNTAKIVDETAMRRLQLAQRRQLQRDQETHHDELQQMLEIADKDRAGRDAHEAEDEETGTGGHS